MKESTKKALLDFKWYITFVIAFTSLILAYFSYISMTKEKPEDSITDYLVSIDEKTFYKDILIQFSEIKSDVISKIDIISKPSDYNDLNRNAIELKVQFIIKTNDDLAKVRAFFVDPNGIVRYEYPNNAVTNLTSNEGFNDLNKKISFIVNYNEEAPLKIYGTWHLNILLLSKNNDSIGELVEPVNIEAGQSSNTLDLSQNTIILFVLIIVILILILLFGIFIYRYKNQPNKIKKGKIKIKNIYGEKTIDTNLRSRKKDEIESIIIPIIHQCNNEIKNIDKKRFFIIEKFEPFYEDISKNDIKKMVYDEFIQNQLSFSKMIYTHDECINQIKNNCNLISKKFNESRYQLKIKNMLSEFNKNSTTKISENNISSLSKTLLITIMENPDENHILLGEPEKSFWKKNEKELLTLREQDFKNLLEELNVLSKKLKDLDHKIVNYLKKICNAYSKEYGISLEKELNSPFFNYLLLII